LKRLWPRWCAPLAVLVVLVSASAAQDRPPYERSLYRHWIRVEGTCRDVRAVVLIRGAEPGTIIFADPGECRVGGGVWRDPYTGQMFTSPSDIDIDHMVPLKNAHESGGWAWDQDRRRQYANNLTYRWHLLAVSRSANRSKGDRSPDQWKPGNPDFWCQYGEAWATVKTLYQLETTEPERAALREILATC
jgi:hypothetical protein